MRVVPALSTSTGKESVPFQLTGRMMSTSSQLCPDPVVSGSDRFQYELRKRTEEKDLFLCGPGAAYTLGHKPAFPARSLCHPLLSNLLLRPATLQTHLPLSFLPGIACAGLLRVPFASSKHLLTLQFPEQTFFLCGALPRQE